MSSGKPAETWIWKWGSLDHYSKAGCCLKSICLSSCVLPFLSSPFWRWRGTLLLSQVALCIHCRKCPLSHFDSLNHLPLHQRTEKSEPIFQCNQVGWSGNWLSLMYLFHLYQKWTYPWWVKLMQISHWGHYCTEPIWSISKASSTEHTCSIQCSSSKCICSKVSS